LLQWSPEAVLWGVVGGCGLVALHLGLLRPGGSRNPLYRTIYRPLIRTLRPRLRDVRTLSLVLLAVASGMGEEVLFRGWLQAEVGLVGASLLFGAVHVWGRDAWPYGLYAAAMGAGLGGLLIVTGSLWAPIFAHGLNNLLGFLALRDGWVISSDSV
jgi:membrane protease YdiL (CAAX protease family)